MHINRFGPCSNKTWSEYGQKRIMGRMTRRTRCTCWTLTSILTRKSMPDWAGLILTQIPPVRSKTLVKCPGGWAVEKGAGIYDTLFNELPSKRSTPGQDKKTPSHWIIWEKTYTLLACANARDLSLSSYHATAYKFVVLPLSENLSALETVYKKVRERSNSLIAILTTIQYEATREILRTNCYLLQWRNNIRLSYDATLFFFPGLL